MLSRQSVGVTASLTSPSQFVASTDNSEVAGHSSAFTYDEEEEEEATVDENNHDLVIQKDHHNWVCDEYETNFIFHNIINSLSLALTLED